MFSGYSVFICLLHSDAPRFPAPPATCLSTRAHAVELTTLLSEFCDSRGLCAELVHIPVSGRLRLASLLSAPPETIFKRKDFLWLMTSEGSPHIYLTLTLKQSTPMAEGLERTRSLVTNLLTAWKQMGGGSQKREGEGERGNKSYFSKVHSSDTHPASPTLFLPPPSNLMSSDYASIRGLINWLGLSPHDPVISQQYFSCQSTKPPA